MFTVPGSNYKSRSEYMYLKEISECDVRASSPSSKNGYVF